MATVGVKGLNRWNSGRANTCRRHVVEHVDDAMFEHDKISSTRVFLLRSRAFSSPGSCWRPTAAGRLYDRQRTGIS